MDEYQVTKALWDEVQNWAVTHGYRFEYGAQAKANDHPAHSMTWYDAVKWCNARSEKEGRVPAYYTSAARTKVYRGAQTDLQNDWVKWNRGYRLLTEAEWEKTARGGASGRRLPWSDADTISHIRADHWVYQSYGTNSPTCEVSPPTALDPTLAAADLQCTSPVGCLVANGGGLSDMAEIFREWCWDWYGPYSSSPGTDPRGPTSGLYRVVRGGPWVNLANGVWCAYRNYNHPHNRDNNTGFRCGLGDQQHS